MDGVKPGNPGALDVAGIEPVSPRDIRCNGEAVRGAKLLVPARSPDPGIPGGLAGRDFDSLGDADVDAASALVLCVAVFVLPKGDAGFSGDVGDGMVNLCKKYLRLHHHKSQPIVRM